MKRIERNNSIVKVLSSKNIKLTGSAYLAEISNRHKYKTICLEEIRFEFNGEEYEIDHCWLQQMDYPGYFRSKAIEGELYYFEFTFYPYRDDTSRDDMHGMDIKYIEPY